MIDSNELVAITFHADHMDKPRIRVLAFADALTWADKENNEALGCPDAWLVYTRLTHEEVGLDPVFDDVTHKAIGFTTKELRV